MSVRFDTLDEKGETRRDRNIRFFSPEMNRTAVIPRGCEHYVSWFWDLSSLRKWGEAGPEPVTPDLLMGWTALTGVKMSRQDVSILRQMDDAFRSAVARERKEQMDRERARR